MRKVCLLLSLLTAIILNSSAQKIAPENVHISGTIVDSSGRPVPGATLTFLYKSAIIKGMIPNDTGGFEFTRDSILVDTLKITATGFEEKVVPIQFTAASPKILSLGSIMLQAYTKELATVVVAAKKPLVQREADRIIYNVESDPERNAASVLDLMRKAPYLSLDPQRNLLYKGGTDYKVFINGKPSGLLANNPSEVLRNMPATSVERIEVITYPSAKYDAEGVAGIINLVTIKKINDAYAGSVNMKTAFPEGNKPELGLSFTARQKKWGVNIFAGANRYNNPFNSSQRIRTATDNELEENGQSKSKGNGGYWGSEVSYEIDSLQLLFAQLNFNGSGASGLSQQNTRISSAGIPIRFELENRNSNSWQNIDVGLNYQLGFKKDKSKTLTTAYKFWQNRSNNESIGHFYNESNYNGDDYNQQNKNYNKEHTLQIDYGQAIKNLNVEAGIKTIFRNNNSNYEFALYDSAIGTYQADAQNTNNFKNEQQILSAYNTWQYGFKSWFFRAGARAEQTFTNVGFQNSGSRIQQKYLNIIPNILASKKWKNNSSLSAGFSQRLRRPGINKLNPFVDRSNPTVERTGNPNLEASIMNTFKLDYGISKKMNINIGIDYSYGRHMELRIMTYDPATGITHITYGNVGKLSGLSLNYFASYPITDKWKVTVNGNVIKFSGFGMVDAGTVELDRIVSRNTVAMSYVMGSGWNFNGSFFAESRSITDLQATSNAYMGSSFNLSKNVWSDKLSLSAFAENPFSKFRHRMITINGNNFTELNDYKEYFRRVGCSITFKFGGKNVSIRKSKKTINNNDVSD